MARGVLVPAEDGQWRQLPHRERVVAVVQHEQQVGHVEARAHLVEEEQRRALLRAAAARDLAHEQAAGVHGYDVAAFGAVDRVRGRSIISRVTPERNGSSAAAIATSQPGCEA